MVESELPAWDYEDDVDPWGWAHEDVADDHVDLSGASVTAVLVAHDAARWLPEALAALAAQTRRPDRVMAVDAGSSDATSSLLRQAAADGVVDAVIAGESAAGFGGAVSAAVAQAPVTEWLWLLHDDAEPLPGALAAQLELGVERGAGVVVPKLLQARRRGVKQIAEMGASVSASGNRVLDNPPGDIDQGQLESRATLGGSSCGLLIRRDLWDRLGGFDPALPLFRDGVEFGWRANLLGEPVLTCPQAEIVHRQLGRAGLRSDVADPTVLDRRYGLVAAAGHRRGIGAVLGALGAVLGLLFGALGYLLGKAPGRAAANLRSLAGYMGSGAEVRALRRRVAALDPSADNRRRAAALRPRAIAAPAAAARAAAGAIGDRWYDAFGSGRDGNLDDLIGDDFSGDRYLGRVRRPWLVPTLIAWLALVGLALIAARRLFSLGHLTSVRLAPAPESWRALYSAYAASVPGTHDVGPAWLGWFVAASGLLAGQPEWVVTLLVFLVAPLAMIPSYLLLRTVTDDRRAQLIGALLAATAPALIGATARGALGTLVLAIVLPCLALAVRGWQRRGSQGYEGWRSAFIVGLLLSVWTSFQPLAWALALVVAAIAGARSRRGGALLRILVALLVPALLLAPWLPTLVRHPGRLLTGEDPSLVGADTAPTSLLLLGRSAGPGLPPLWLSVAVFLIVWVLALVGLFLRPGRALRYVGAALAGLALAVLATRVLVAVPGAAHVHPTVLPWLLLMTDALICAAATGFDRVTARLSATSFGSRQLGALTALAAAALATALSAGWFASGGLGAPLHRSDRVLPLYVDAALRPPASGRALVIDAHGAQPSYVVAEDGATTLGGPERGGFAGGDPAAAEVARQLTANLVAGRSDATVANELTQLGIRYVVVRGAAQDLAGSITAVPGLQTASTDEGARVWRVTEHTGAAPVGPGAPSRPGVVWWALAQLAGLVLLIILATPALRRGSARDPEAYARRAAGSGAATEAVPAAAPERVAPRASETDAASSTERDGVAGAPVAGAHAAPRPQRAQEEDR